MKRIILILLVSTMLSGCSFNGPTYISTDINGNSVTFIDDSGFELVLSEGHLLYEYLLGMNQSY